MSTKPLAVYRQPDKMLPAVRLFVTARRAALDMGLTDNAMAIHSLERGIDLLGMAARYPHLAHVADYRKDSGAEMSKAAKTALAAGQRVEIEHVAPKRALARAVGDLIERGADDADVMAYLERTYRLVLLTANERQQVDRVNRSSLTPDRIAEAGIEMA